MYRIPVCGQASRSVSALHLAVGVAGVLVDELDYGRIPRQPIPESAAHRSGLMIGALEDAEDYQAFEEAVIADYDVQSAVERELTIGRPAVAAAPRHDIETGPFEFQADYLREFRQAPVSREVVYALFGRVTQSVLIHIARHHKRYSSPALLRPEIRRSSRRSWR